MLKQLDEEIRHLFFLLQLENIAFYYRQNNKQNLPEQDQQADLLNNRAHHTHLSL